MPEMTKYESGTPSWVDIGTSDIPGAIRFYGELFGWEAEDQGADAGGYHMLSLDGKHVAGLGPQMNPGPPYWTSYVSVADVDAVCERIGAAGGTVIVPPMDVFDSGRMAVAMDPAGAAFAMWQPNQHIGAQLVNEPGSLCWNELMTTDVEGSKTFYGTVFGWGARTSESPMEYTEFLNGERSIAGMMAKPPTVPAEVPSNWLVYFTVSDCDAAVKQAEASGGSVSMPPMDIPIGRFAVLQDPQGATFAVIALTGEPAG
jgi:predicted enzyme related to lactoylglutathione lyase